MFVLCRGSPLAARCRLLDFGPEAEVLEPPDARDDLADPGTPEQIAERVVAYERLGVDLFLLGFLHYLEEVEYFGKRVLPLVRELEAREAESEPVDARV